MCGHVPNCAVPLRSRQLHWGSNRVSAGVDAAAQVIRIEAVESPAAPQNLCAAPTVPHARHVMTCLTSPLPGEGHVTIANLEGFTE